VRARLDPRRQRRVAQAERGDRSQPRGRIAVFAPSPLLTITIEPGADRPDVHLHADGKGFWVARLAATLGADVTLCCALGGEPGRVLAGWSRARGSNSERRRVAPPTGYTSMTGAAGPARRS
jgi:sugar/nucleoside kinase (ribokinase family)